VQRKIVDGVSYLNPFPRDHKWDHAPVGSRTTAETGVFKGGQHAGTATRGRAI
jgi:hypothetical protein